MTRWSRNSIDGRDTHGTPQEPRVISKTHARDFPALSAARTLPSREYRSPSGIEWSPVAMEIEIYGRTYGARLAAHGIQGCRVSTRRNVQRPGLEVCARSFRTPGRPHTCAIARVFTTESSRNDYFIARLRARYAEDAWMYCGAQQKSEEDVVWKIGSSNRIISLDSCLEVPRSLPRRYRFERFCARS